MEKNQMGYKPILPLLIKMAIPPMISMLIQSLYNIIDSIFVAQMGEAALTSVSLIFPLQNLSLAFSVGIGVAMNALIARYLGENNHQKASYIATQGLMMSILHSLLFVVIGLFFINPFLKMFTTNTQVLNYGQQYGMIVMTFAMGQFIHIAIEKMFQATGDMMIPMIMQIVGAIINIILDPLLIFGYFGFPALGVAGAAIATIIGQISAAILSVILLVKYNKNIHVSLKHYRIDKNAYLKLYSIALPSGVMMCLPSVLVSLLNGVLSTVSQTAVAFFGIYFKLQTFIYMPTNGIIQGMRPIMSYNFGAKQYQRMHDTLKISGIIISLILFAGTSLFMLFPETLLSLFQANAQMLEIGKTGLPILSLSFILSSFAIVMSGIFESLGLGKHSLMISLLRQLLITIPFAFLLLKLIGLNGVWIAFPLGEATASLYSFLLYRKVYKRIGC